MSINCLTILGEIKMDPILNEIKAYFGSDLEKYMLLNTVLTEYPAFVFKKRDKFGVFIPADENEYFRESFSNAVLESEELFINGKFRRCLVLSSTNSKFKSNFAYICSNFVDPGKDGSERMALLKDPDKWFMGWKGLLGNLEESKTTYQIIGELLTLIDLMEQGAKPNWDGPEGGSVDVRFENGSLEVKSTVQRYNAEIVVSEQYQLKNCDILAFFRFEETKNGNFSIESCSDRLIELGFDEKALSSGIQKNSIENTSEWKKKYNLLESRYYLIGEHFPKITNESFIGGKIPAGISKITYTVNLEGLKYASNIAEFLQPR